MGSRSCSEEWSCVSSIIASTYRMSNTNLWYKARGIECALSVCELVPEVTCFLGTTVYENY
jgi:hypothetical protein